MEGVHCTRWREPQIAVCPNSALLSPRRYRGFLELVAALSRNPFRYLGFSGLYHWRQSRTSAHVPVQGASIQQLHRIPRQSFEDAGIEYLHDAGMAQAS